MAPHSIDGQVATDEHVLPSKHGDTTQDSRKPVQSTHALDQLSHEDLTPAIGRAYQDVNIIEDIMKADDADERLRELALVSKCASLTPLTTLC